MGKGEGGSRYGTFWTTAGAPQQSLGDLGPSEVPRLGAGARRQPSEGEGGGEEAKEEVKVAEREGDEEGEEEGTPALGESEDGA
jgi:hypothetical protein